MVKFKKLPRYLFMLPVMGILLLAVSCEMEAKLPSPVLCNVSFASSSERSINVSYGMQSFSNLKDVVLYFKCSSSDANAYASKGADDASAYVLYDGSFVLSQGTWSFDAMIFSKTTYEPSDSTYAIVTGTDSEDNPIYKSSIKVSDKDGYLQYGGSAHAKNSSVQINLNQTTIALGIDKLGGSYGSLNFTYGASSDYVSQYSANGTLPEANATNYSKSRTTTITVQNNFQKISVDIYSTDDLNTPVITKEVHADNDYVENHFSDAKGKTFLLQLKFEDLSLDPGCYVAVVKVYEAAASGTVTRTITRSGTRNNYTYAYTDTKTFSSYPDFSTASAIWLDSVGFVISPGEVTYINGRAGLGSSVPTPTGGVIIVSGDDSDVDSIQESTVTGDYTYVINPNNGSGDTYTLNNTDVDPGTGSRIEVTEGVTDFTIDLNGTNIKTDVSEDNERTTILTLDQGVTANIVNNDASGNTVTIGGTSSSTTSGSNTTDDYEEVYATFEVCGGTLSVTASEAESGAGVTPEIIISGPSRNAGFTGREGAINLSGNGGTVDISGKVAIGAPIDDLDDHTVSADQTVKGITCFLYDDDSTSKTTTVTEGPRKININLSDGASIYANGDSNETPAGIYLYGDNTTFTSGDEININLDNANIAVGVNTNIDSGSGEQAQGYGMRFENMGAASITIKLKDSIIADGWGDVFSFVNCAGDITIEVDNTQIGGAGDGYDAFYFENCTGNISIVFKNNSCIKSAGCFGFGNWVDCNNQNFYFQNCTGNKSITADSTCEFWLRTNTLGTRSGGSYSHIYNSTKTKLTVDGTAVSSNTYVNGAWYTRTQGSGGCWYSAVESKLTSKTLMTATK